MGELCCLTRAHRLVPCVYYSASHKAQHCPAAVPLTLFRRGRRLSPALAVAVQDINIAAEGEGEGTAAPAAVPDAVVVDAAAAAPAEPTASE